jgi:hypothetical protein
MPKDKLRLERVHSIRTGACPPQAGGNHHSEKAGGAIERSIYIFRKIIDTMMHSAGVVKLTFSLAQLPLGMPYSSHDHTTTQPV